MRQPGLHRRSYYGWPMLVGVSTAQVVSWGILYYAFSVLVAPMQADLGWTTVELTGAYSLALLCAGLAAVPVGRWLDRRSRRGHSERHVLHRDAVAVSLESWETSMAAISAVPPYEETA
ncbi:MAG: MFS transporter [Chloroflexales bacterium]|nr:MFS transporter [Chloroflexales bacterium]